MQDFEKMILKGMEESCGTRVDRMNATGHTKTEVADDEQQKFSRLNSDLDSFVLQNNKIAKKITSLLHNPSILWYLRTCLYICMYVCLFRRFHRVLW